MLLVKFEKTIQVNEDEWRNVWIEKVFEEHETLEGIIKWAKKKQNNPIELDVRGLIITEI